RGNYSGHVSINQRAAGPPPICPEPAGERRPAIDDGPDRGGALAAARAETYRPAGGASRRSSRRGQGRAARTRPPRKGHPMIIRKRGDGGGRSAAKASCDHYEKGRGVRFSLP